jgi:glycosyltransferase involved in cell wall biosynthesis
MLKNLVTTGVIANFNQGQFIKNSIQSLAAEVDELIVVDDGSTDGSAKILTQGLPKNTITLFNGKNFGVSYSLNKAIAHARGNVIILQGGDDICIPGRADIQAGHLKSRNVSISYSKPTIIGANGRELPETTAPEFLSSGSPSQAGNLLSLLSLGNTICAPSAAFRKSDFEKVGGFNPNLLYLQDFDLWLSLLMIGTAQKSGQPVVKYRKHNRNLSREGGQDFGSAKRRFDNELEYCLTKATQNIPLGILEEMHHELKIQSSGVIEIDRLLLQLALPLENYKKIAIQNLLELQSIPENRLELENRDLAEQGMRKLINLL